MNSKKTLVILYHSQTGNTLSFAEEVRDAVGDSMDVTIADIVTLGNVGTPAIPMKPDYLMLGAYSWGNGKLPIEMEEFIEDYREWLDNHVEKILFFGSGITVYKHFCIAVDIMEELLERTSCPKVKFELTYEPEHEKENNKIINDFLGGVYL